MSRNLDVLKQYDVPTNFNIHYYYIHVIKWCYVVFIKVYLK